MVFMERDADLIRETQYVMGHMRRNCRHSLWRVEQLLSKLEQGESLHKGGLQASLRSGFLLPSKNPTSCVSKRQLSRLSVVDAGCHTFSAGVRLASTERSASDELGLRPFFLEALGATDALS